jgi:hypothetical protein
VPLSQTDKAFPQAWPVNVRFWAPQRTGGGGRDQTEAGSVSEAGMVAQEYAHAHVAAMEPNPHRSDVDHRVAMDHKFINRIEPEGMVWVEGYLLR